MGYILLYISLQKSHSINEFIGGNIFQSKEKTTFGLDTKNRVN